MKIKDIDLTPEQEAALRDYLPIKASPDFRYVPRAFRASGLPKTTWPVFELKRLSGTEIAASEDLMSGNVSVSAGAGKVEVKRGEYAVLMCRRGIKGWRNLYDKEGAEVAYNPDAVNRLSPALLFELCNAITEQADLTEAELLGLE
jgi:hypothetical protein